MSRVRFAILCALGLFPLITAGCLKCHHTAYRECLRPVENVDVLAPARAKVFVFLMNGADVFDLGGLKELECAIVSDGYPKVYYAQRFDEEWYYKEIHRLRRDDPDNRFILVGQGAAAKQLQQLACRLTTDQIPLDAVVFLDPLGVKGDLATEAEYPSHVIRSNLWLGSPRLNTTESMKLSRSGHLRLPNRPETVDALVSIIAESARRVPYVMPAIDCVPVVDEHKPIPRPSEPKSVPVMPPGWNILCPEFGQG